MLLDLQGGRYTFPLIHRPQRQSSHTLRGSQNGLNRPAFKDFGVGCSIDATASRGRRSWLGNAVDTRQERMAM
jgi:hypothetical protein